MNSMTQRLAQDLAIPASQVSAAIGLLDEGASVPFISRYRKEVTGGLTDTQLRQLSERLRYCRELEERRTTILNSIKQQERLNDSLAHAILHASDKTTLEDLYLPYKPKRRTKGQIAIERGLAPLAEALFADPQRSPEKTAAAYLTQDIADVTAALEGARSILMEGFAEQAALLSAVRDLCWQQGVMTAKVVSGQEQTGRRFQDYFAYSEAIRKLPGHRVLALLRGRSEHILQLSLQLADGQAESCMAEQLAWQHQNRAGDDWIADVIRATWRVKLKPRMETDLFNRVREKAETGAIDVFADNLKNLLLAAPAGAQATLGLDPGLRTGVKLAVIDATGKVVDHDTIFPTPPRNQFRPAETTLVKLCRQHQVRLIAIGNGTGSRETDRFVSDVLKAHPDIQAQAVMVNEAGASIYSASESAAEELPDLDVTIRGAVSIARRLQDPLAELVKIDPKSIGVGQYQHDVSQSALARKLDAVVEDCVNQIGVDVNTASMALLKRVSGLTASTAANLVAFRDAKGAFATRKELKAVPRLGDKAYEQAAGFLKIIGGKEPLDASAVHPESYSLVRRIAARSQRSVPELIGDIPFLRRLNPADFIDKHLGLPTVTDILKELEKPGRDPRPAFKTAQFQTDVETLADLTLNRVLEGVVTNVTHFGAFVDVGVHQDGLVHISAMSDRFISNPSQVVKAGDIIQVKVMSVDKERQRIGLSMRLSDEAESAQMTSHKKALKAEKTPAKPTRAKPTKATRAPANTTLADVLQKALKDKQGSNR